MKKALPCMDTGHTCFLIWGVLSHKQKHRKGVTCPLLSSPGCGACPPRTGPGRRAHVIDGMAVVHRLIPFSFLNFSFISATMSISSPFFLFLLNPATSPPPVQAEFHFSPMSSRELRRSERLFSCWFVLSI